MMKIFESVIDDGAQVFKTKVPAESKKELLDVWGGNGEFVSIKDITAEAFKSFDIDKMMNLINSSDLNELERMFMATLLENELKKHR